MEENPYTNSFAVDFIQFKGISKLGDSPAEVISAEIKKFRQIFENSGNSNKRLNVDVYDSKDRKIEAEEFQAMLLERQRRRDNPT